MKLSFVIHGNHEDATGNPLPKIKQTRNQYWTPRAQRYAAWKTYVQQKLIESMRGKEFMELREVFKGIEFVNGGKPLDLGTRPARMDLKIFWKDGTHGDAENVFGSIADAIFQNDKHLDGSFEGRDSPEGKGRVEVEIQIMPPREKAKRKTKKNVRKKETE